MNSVLAAPAAYTDEATFLADHETLGYISLHEGFENNAAWGSIGSIKTT